MFSYRLQFVLHIITEYLTSLWIDCPGLEINHFFFVNIFNSDVVYDRNSSDNQFSD